MDEASRGRARCRRKEAVGPKLVTKAKSDQALLSNDEIDAILSSRIQLPARAHLTILRLGSTDEVLAWALLSGSASPFGELANAPRLTLPRICGHQVDQLFVA